MQDQHKPITNESIHIDDFVIFLIIQLKWSQSIILEQGFIFNILIRFFEKDMWVGVSEIDYSGTGGKLFSV